VVAVQGANSAISALSEAARGGEAFDAALLDDAVGETGLIEIAARIRDAGAAPEVPVILVLNAGAAPLIASNGKSRILRVLKPVRREQLRQVLAEAVDPRLESGSTRAMTPVRAKSRPLRVLVADDVPVNRRLTQRLLELAGHSVRSVSDGREALDAVQREHFDLVLMDVEMPGLHGLDAAAAIRTLPGPTARVPIIAVTAHSEALYLTRCREAGMDDFLTKPIDADRLHAIIERLTSPA